MMLKRLIYLELCVLAAGTVAATDLYWNNAAGNGFWEEVSTNWVDAAGNPSAYVAGANAWFLEDRWGGTNTGVTIKKLKVDEGKTASTSFQFPTGDMIISNETATFTWSADNNTWYNYHTGTGTDGESGGLRKYGAGTFYITVHNQFNGDCDIFGGKVSARTGSSHPGDYRSALGSLIKSGRFIRFHPGTTLEVTSSFPFGGPTAGGSVTWLFTNATLNVASGGSFHIGKTTFHDCTIGTFNVGSGTVYFSGDLTLSGSTPYTFSANNTGARIVFGKNNDFVNVTVDDITGDAEPDLTISAKLGSEMYVGVSQSRNLAKKNFKKYGAGTMKLTNPSSPITGDLQVVEGTLWTETSQNPDLRSMDHYKLSVLGAVDGVARTITVGPQGTLHLGTGSGLGLIDTPASYRLYVNGGRLELSDYAIYVFGELDLENATFTYGNGSKYSWFHYGLFSVGKKIRFAGTTPYDLNVRGTENYFTLGFTADTPLEDHPIKPGSIFTNCLSVVEMETADITGNGDVDAAIGMEIRDTPNMCYPTYGAANTYTYLPRKYYRFRGGINKTGAGTLRLYGVNTYTHTTRVSAGILRVDGTIASSSNVTVAAGAYLGGTGTVSAVTVQAGGGFALDVRDGKDDVLKVPSLVTEGAVTVKVTGTTAATDPTTFARRVVKITGRPATLALDNWTLDFPGQRSGSFRFLYDATTGLVRTKPCFGTIMIVR